MNFALEISDRAVLGRRFQELRSVLEKLAAPLQLEDCALSVTDDTSPPKWHLAHTTWFFERFLLRPAGHAPVDPVYDYLFNSYYRGAGSFLEKRKRFHLSRPTMEDVLRYRKIVNERMIEVLANSVELPLDVIELALHHEQQHQELLLMDVKRNFYANPMRPAYDGNAPIVGAPAPASGWRIFAGGIAGIGARDGEPFAYDNEYGRHSVWLEPFALARRVVTNGEYLGFIEGGGYENPAYWLSDGWDWVRANGVSAPLYWERSGDKWHEMTLYGMRELELDAPVVHVNYYEADAYARFRRCRLPTEFEWEFAAEHDEIRGQFLDDECLHPLPEAASSLHGGVWEWTSSAYLPYPRYRGYSGILAEYNGKFFCNQWVLRGGSCVTPKEHYRRTYRNFYYPHMRWQFSGIRLARNL